MKKWIVGIVFCFFGLSSQPTAAAELPTNFEGTWVDQAATELTFDITLEQEGNTLRGYHCGVTPDATRIDCSLEGEEITITGTITGSVAKVKFTSAYSGQIGMARITQQGNSLLWEITAFPNGEYYLPDRAILTKVNISEDAEPQPISLVQDFTARVQHDLKKRGYQYEVKLDPNLLIFDDFDANGTIDIAAIFYPFDEHIEEPNSEVRSENRFLAIGFTDNTEIQLVLNEPAILCLDCGGVYGEPDITLTSQNGVISTSSYGGSAWRWFEEQKLRYENGKFVVIGYTESSSYPVNELSVGYDLNFNTLEALRMYDIGASHSEARFKNLIAQTRPGQLTIDGILKADEWENAMTVEIRDQTAVVHKPENWNGSSDVSFTAATVWDVDNLYIAVNVTDDQVVPVESWDGLLKGDHLELWFDFADVIVELTAEEAHVRQKPDEFVVQLGIGIPEHGGKNLIRYFYPEKPDADYGIVSASSLTENGYQVEIQIPFAVFREFLPSDFQWANSSQFGFTIVVSDTDNAAKRAQDCLMATSAVKWGNPFTFGACYLFDHYEKPDFPLKHWRARY